MSALILIVVAVVLLGGGAEHLAHKALKYLAAVVAAALLLPALFGSLWASPAVRSGMATGVVLLTVAAVALVAAKLLSHAPHRAPRHALDRPSVRARVRLVDEPQAPDALFAHGEGGRGAGDDLDLFPGEEHADR